LFSSASLASAERSMVAAVGLALGVVPINSKVLRSNLNSFIFGF
jgi:hypothetical protein